MARERILVVDDEPGMRRAIDRVLGRHYPVTEAASAEDALAEMARETFDLVLADIRMPGMDGLELLSRIRSTSAADVILMTGSLGEGDERRALFDEDAHRPEGQVGATEDRVDPAQVAQVAEQRGSIR